MSGENCLVCASDEGVFLDVEQQPTLRAKALNCRLEKVLEECPLTKVCHKCAFEIEQCNTFVEKVKKASKTQQAKRACCVLCLDAYNKDIFFDLSKQKIARSDFVQRIRNLFVEELKDKDFKKQFICLSCRYFVDLLTDLRNLSNEIPGKLKITIKNGINPADLPKTKTSIVNRKTTFIQSSNLDLNTPSDTDSENSTIMGSRKKVSKTKSPAIKPDHKCGKCKITVKSNADMYRIYRTGVTVCKHCWLTIDPGKNPSRKRKKIQPIETKLCSVLLVDLYQTNYLKEKDYEIKKDSVGHTVFKVTKNSEDKNRTKQKTNNVSLKDIQEDKNVEVKKGKSIRGGNRRKVSEQSSKEEPEVKLTRSTRRRESEQSITEEMEEKLSRAVRKRNESEQSLQEEHKPTRATTRRKDSEQSIQEEPQFSRSNRNTKNSNLDSTEDGEFKATRLTRKRKESEQSIQEEEIKSMKNNRNRKDSEQSTKERKSTRGRRRKVSEQSVQEESEVIVDVDSDSAPISKKAKKTDGSAETMPKQATKSNESNQSASTRKRGRSSSIESTSSIRKSTRNTKKNNVQELDEIVEIEDDSESTKMEKDDDSGNEEMVQESKRSRMDKQTSGDENSDTESIVSERKDSSKASTSKSSKISPKFKAPNKKDSQKVNTESAKIAKGDKAKISRVKKPDDSESLKSVEIDTSESEEIDVLKSTDEETKGDDAIEAVTEETITKSVTVAVSVHTVSIDDNSKINEDTAEDQLELELIEEVSVDEENSKTVKENSHIDQIHEDTETEINNENLNTLVTENTNTELTESSKSSKPNSTKLKKVANSDEEDIIEAAEEENSETVAEESVDKEEIASDAEKTDKHAEEDIDDDDKQSDDYNNSKSEKKLAKENVTSTARSPRKSKSTARNPSKNDIAPSNDIIIYDSDTEIKVEDEDAQLSYSCKFCDKVYENKYFGLQHELRHMKTLELKLEKLPPTEINKIPNDSDDEQETEHQEVNAEEKMDVNDESEKIETSTSLTQKEDENKTVEENDVEMQEPNEDGDDHMTDVEQQSEVVNDSNENEKNVEKKEKENGEIIEENSVEESSGKEDLTDAESELNMTSNKKSRRSTRKIEQSVPIEKDNRDRKSRGRRKTVNDIVEPEETISTAIESETDKIAEAVQETLNDMAELHGKIKDAEPLERISESKEVTESDKSQSIEPDVNNEIENEKKMENNDGNITEIAENTENKDSDVVEQTDITTKTPEPSEENAECTTTNEKDTADADVPVVSIDDGDSSKEIVDLESESAQSSKKSGIEITEIDDVEADKIGCSESVQCEQVDLTEGEDCKEQEVVNDVEIEEIVEESKTIQEDENTLDSGTEINVIAADEPCVENNDANARQAASNDEEDNNTEEEEALAQESLEELLQRKGLQIIDEFAESVTDGDEESEKEANVSASSQRSKEIEGELEIKISEAECTEILEISSSRPVKEKEVDNDVVGESQIIQDVDVVEEVIHDDDDDQPHAEVGQEVEVESNVVSFDFPALY